MFSGIFFLVCFSLSLSITSSSSNIACSYVPYIYNKIGQLYHCNVLTALNIIDQESAIIGAISGFHATSKTDDDVTGFFVDNKRVDFFPKGIDVFFKNIKAISFHSCAMKEIYQDDLKPFSKLAYLRIFGSAIEVLEEGLFAYNPELQVVGIEGSKLTHIDPNIFDHLTKLDHFWFQQASCVNIKYISDSRSKVEAAINSMKARCVSMEYLQLDANLRALERESKILSFEQFKKNFDSFENINKNSKFLKFRPLKMKFKALKSFDDGSVSVITTTTLSTPVQANNNLKSISIDQKILTESNSLSFLINELKNITTDLKSSQCDLRSESDQLKVNIATTSDSLNILTQKIKSSQEETRTIQYEIKGTISDIESSLSGLKTLQNEAKMELIKIKTTQNEIKMSIDDLKSSKSENFDVKSKNMEAFEGQLGDIKEENAENFKNIQNEIANKFHKMTISFDEKIKTIEKESLRILGKF